MADDYYDSIASGYDALYADEQLAKLDLVSQQIVCFRKINEETTILDVGCGSGISSDYWVRRFGAQVTGIDPASRLLAQNQNNLSRLLVGSAESLSFEDESFDIIVSFTAIQNFSDISLSLGEMKRVGKKDTLFVITTLTGGPAFAQIRDAIDSALKVIVTDTAQNDTVFIASRR